MVRYLIGIGLILLSALSMGVGRLVYGRMHGDPKSRVLMWAILCMPCGAPVLGSIGYLLIHFAPLEIAGEALMIAAITALMAHFIMFGIYLMTRVVGRRKES